MRRIYTVFLFIVMASLDNTVLALLPVMTPRIRAEFGVTNQALGFVIGINLAVVAVTGLFWGYSSDRTDRRRLLIVGTIAWAVPVGLVAWSRSYGLLVGLMALAGLGLGCISTVGYSIITDMVSQRWRGVLLGIWGLAQGIGSLAAGLLAGLMSQAYGWRTPFGFMAAAGAACCVLACFAVSPRKGAAEEALQALDDQGGEYEYRIKSSDLPLVLAKPSNRWLMLQGFLAQFTYGSLTWIAALLTAKLVAQGVALDLANGIAALLWVILQLGGVISVLWGWVGDRLQRRYPQARALLAAYGFWIAIPCYIVLFWTPLPISRTTAAAPLAVVLEQFTVHGSWWLVVLAATLAVAAQATNAPNWYALVCDVNLPEHRGTAFSFVTLANNIGRALGALLVGVTFDWLLRTVSTPANYALGLTLWQLFFIPAGLCFWLAARTTPRDAAVVEQILQDRAAQSRAASPTANQLLPEAS